MVVVPHLGSGDTFGQQKKSPGIYSIKPCLLPALNLVIGNSNMRIDRPKRHIAIRKKVRKKRAGHDVKMDVSR